MGTEIWIISLPLSDSILCLKIIHPPNFREEPIFYTFSIAPQWIWASPAFPPVGTL